MPDPANLQARLDQALNFIETVLTRDIGLICASSLHSAIFLQKNHISYPGIVICFFLERRGPATNAAITQHLALIRQQSSTAHRITDLLRDKYITFTPQDKTYNLTQKGRKILQAWYKTTSALLDRDDYLALTPRHLPAEHIDSDTHSC